MLQRVFVGSLQGDWGRMLLITFLKGHIGSCVAPSYCKVMSTVPELYRNTLHSLTAVDTVVSK